MWGSQTPQLGPREKWEVRLLIFLPLDSQTYVVHILGLEHPITIIYLIEYYILWGGTYPHQVLSVNWHLSCTFKKPFSQQQLGGAVFDRTSVFHDPVPTATLPLL